MGYCCISLMSRKGLRAEKISGQKTPQNRKSLGAAKFSGQQRSQGSKGLRAAKVSGQKRSRGSKCLFALGQTVVREDKVRGCKCLGQKVFGGRKSP